MSENIGPIAPPDPTPLASAISQLDTVARLRRTPDEPTPEQIDAVQSVADYLRDLQQSGDPQA